MVDFNKLKHSLPKELENILVEYSWEDNTFGYSGTSVFKLSSNKDLLYLKVNQPNSVFNLEREKTILEWLNGKLPVPSVIHFCVHNNMEFLLLSEIKGDNSHIFEEEDNKRINIQILAEGLKAIHAIHVKDCPVDNNPDKLLELAKNILESTTLDSEQFDNRWKNKTPETLYSELLELKPKDYDLVFSHGDYCLPNIIIKNRKLSGFIDWPWGGINDRYFDLAAVAWSIGYNYGEEWVNPFFESYGIENIDWNRIHFYQMLNEFFQQ